MCYIGNKMNAGEERDKVSKDNRKQIPLVERWAMDDNPIKIIKTAQQAKEEEAKAEEAKKLAEKGESTKQ